MKPAMKHLFFALASAWLCSQPAGAASLIEFHDAGPSRKAGSEAGNPALLGERTVSLKADAVDADTTHLVVPIDGGRPLILERTSMQRGADGMSWYWKGRGINGMEHYEGRFLFTAASASGILDAPQRQWRLEPTGRGDFSWMELDPKKLRLAHAEDVVHRGPLATASQPESAPALKILQETTVDILVSVDTRLYANYADAYARATREVVAANEMFEDSQTGVRLRLVGVQQVGDVPLTGAEYQLAPLVNPNDGVMDSIHTRRNELNADIVVLLSKTSGWVCGIAESLMPTPAQAFAVVNGQSACDDRLFAHEVGHLFSADHDDLAYNPTNTKPYARGFVANLEGEAAPQSYATIMTYNTSDRCIIGWDMRQPIRGYCQRARIFSNPDILHELVPAGDALHNNARAIREEAARLASFRGYTGTMLRSGTWHNANRPGHGLQFSRSGNGTIATWYTYRTNGTPIWYFTDVATVASGEWRSNLYQSRRNTSTGAVTVQTVGKVRMRLFNAQEGEFEWDFYANGTGWDGSENHQYLTGGGSYEGTWHEPAQPGWGIGISSSNTQSGGLVFYFHGSDPAWVSAEVGAGLPTGGRYYSLRRYTGSGVCPSCTNQPHALTSIPAGSMQLSFTSTGGTAVVRIQTADGHSWTRGSTSAPVTMERLTSQ